MSTAKVMAVGLIALGMVSRTFQQSPVNRTFLAVRVHAPGSAVVGTPGPRCGVFDLVQACAVRISGAVIRTVDWPAKRPRDAGMRVLTSIASSSARNARAARCGGINAALREAPMYRAAPATARRIRIPIVPRHRVDRNPDMPYRIVAKDFGIAAAGSPRSQRLS